MTRTVRDYVQIGGDGSLDRLIEQLTAIRDSLPTDAGPEVRMRGDDFFGRHIAIGFNRPLTAGEAEIQGRYSGESKERGRLRAA